MTYVVDFKQVSTKGLEKSPVATALAGLRANEARYFMNKYGHAFTTARPSRLAVVPVGYADGYPRRLSNTPHAVVSLHGRRAPVVGRVSMDQIIVDVTDIPPAAVADPVTVFSWDPADPHALDPLADALGTIGYELATHLGHRLRRVIVD